MKSNGESRGPDGFSGRDDGWRPDLLEQFGVGPIVAATVLSAFSHSGRIHSEAAFAMLAGVAPIPATAAR